jgi:hypothetical protein
MLLNSGCLHVASWCETGVNIRNKRANMCNFRSQWMRFCGSGCVRRGSAFEAVDGVFELIVAGGKGVCAGSGMVGPPWAACFVSKCRTNYHCAPLTNNYRQG